MGASDVLAAPADENRCKILTTLKRGLIFSGALAQAAGMTSQALSYPARHSRFLRDHGGPAGVC